MFGIGMPELIVLIFVGGSIFFFRFLYHLGSRRKIKWLGYLLAVIAPPGAYFYMRRLRVGIMLIILSLVLRPLSGSYLVALIALLLWGVIVWVTIKAVKVWLRSEVT